MYSQLSYITETEQLIQQKFTDREYKGTAHLCLGEEAVAVGVCNALDKKDMIFVTHRGHGFYLLRAGKEKLLKEIEAGNSQHLYSNNVLANGIVGGLIPVATGWALAQKLKNTGYCAVVVFGDGATGQGVLYESMNMASIWRLPIIFVCINNNIAMTSPASEFVSGSILSRARAFDISAWSLDIGLMGDINAAKKISCHIQAAKRNKDYPFFLEIKTQRKTGHSVNK